MNRQEKVLFGISFFFSFCLALAAYINASFLKQTVSTEIVGYIYAITAICTIGVLYLFEKIGHKYSIKNALTWFLFSAGIHALLLFTFEYFFISIYAFIVMQTSLVAVKVSLDLLVESHKTNVSEGTLRGGFLTISNFGWVLAAGLGGIIASIDFKYIYVLNGLMYLGLAYIAYILVMHIQKDTIPKSTLFEKIALIKKNNPTKKIIISEFLLQVFYATMILFSPLFLKEIHHFSLKEIGFVFSLMLLPFILIQYPLGKLADKKYGEKEFLILGYAIIAISVIMFALIPQHTFLTAAITLFLSRVGAATIEVMNDTYFYSVTSEYKKLINILKSMAPVAILIVGITAGFIIKQTSYSTLFVLLGILLGVYGIFNLKNIRDTR